MKSLLITGTALIAALLVVLGTRVIIPALEIIYYYLLKSFEPQEPQLCTVAAAPAVMPTPQTAPSKPKTTRRRRSSAATASKSKASNS